MPFAEETIDGQRQRVDVPVHPRTSHDGLSQKQIGRGSLLSRPSCPLLPSPPPTTTLSIKELN